MKKFKNFSIVALTILLSFSVKAQFPTKARDGKTDLNLDKNGCMVQGYDCVAMFTMPDSTLKGSQGFESELNGAKYWFVSAANKAIFDANPNKYAPLYGGFCGIAVTEGNLRPIQVWTHTITEGHLILNHNAKASGLWLKKPAKNFKKAQNMWPIVGMKEAKYDFIHPGETQESVSETSYGWPKK